jgi:primary-amine oxidase
LPATKLLFPDVVLREPAKAAVLAHLDSGGPKPPREARVEALHYPTNRVWVATVNLGTNAVTSLVLQPAGTQSPVSADEFVKADAVVHANGTWQAAMTARGLDPDKCYIDVWAPGDPPGEGTLSFGTKTRLLRCLTFYRGTDRPQEDDNPYDRPVEGVIVTLDMNAETVVGAETLQGKVVDVNDTGIRPVSTETGNAATERPPLPGLSYTGGSSYQRSGPDGRAVSWQKWTFFVSFNVREGLVLYDVRFDGRRVAYRLSLSEIYVPYGIGDENWVFRTAFDVGEYWLGQYGQALAPGEDVPSNAQFFDAAVAIDTGGAYGLPDVVGIYERFGGIAWTRTDPSLFSRDTRGARELVVTWNAWIGNYIYGFNWVFRQDGSIEVITDLTGTLLCRGSASREGEGAVDDAAPLVGEAPRVPGSASGGSPDGLARVRAPVHQHFFSFRLDLDVDGLANAVATHDVVHTPMGDAGGFENVFAGVETLFASEGSSVADPTKAREWEVQSTVATNGLGGETAYSISLPNFCVPLSEPMFEPLQRAAFAQKQFWVTRYKDGELYAAGDFPNQGAQGEGLPAFADGEALNPGAGTDVVVWVTPAITHVPRPEDYPVMPTESIRFKISAHGFFDRNPTLDLPR